MKITKLQEDWYRVTCDGGNNWGDATLCFTKPDSNGVFGIGVKSKANFNKAEQVTFKSEDDALEFGNKVLNSKVGQSKGMTKIHGTQFIPENKLTNMVEVDTIFGKAWMRPECYKHYSDKGSFIKKGFDFIKTELEQNGFHFVTQNKNKYVFLSDNEYEYGSSYKSQICIDVILYTSKIEILYSVKNAIVAYSYSTYNKYDDLTKNFLNNMKLKLDVDDNYNYHIKDIKTESELQEFKEIFPNSSIGEYVLLWE